GARCPSRGVRVGDRTRATRVPPRRQRRRFLPIAQGDGGGGDRRVRVADRGGRSGRTVLAIDPGGVAGMSLSLNPVLGREVRERFRSRRAPIFVTLWVLGVGLIGYLVYLIAQLAARDAFGLGQGVAGGYMGRFIFEGMLLVLMTAVVMIVPGLTALSIVGEKERQTFHLLQVTQLSPIQIVLGKIWSSMSYFILLLVAVAPVAALPLLFGGVRITDVLVGLGMLLLTAVMLGSVGI